MSRQTLKSYLDKFIAASSPTEGDSIPIVNLTLDQVFGGGRLTAGPKPLLDKEEVELLANTIVYRDESNNGMTRSEVTDLIMEMKQGVPSRKQADDHYQYLINTGRLAALGVKKGGRVVRAQATTDKRSQITPEQQWRWYTTVDQAFAELERLNQPSSSFHPLREYFVANLDETCYMSNMDGQVRVVASAAKKKTEKITDDSRLSITSIRVGTAGGTQGPFIFLAKGQSIEYKMFRGDLSERHDVPPGSKVVMTPNAYLTDEVYANLADDLCRGIRSMPVIVDHPEWWVCVSMDGFGSHVNVESAHECFAEHKILVIKEEGDTSQVNQAYDQFVAKDDKRIIRDYLHNFRRVVKMDQWHVIRCAMAAQAQVTAVSWINSFKRVNMHPKHRVSFNDWMKKLADRGILSEGGNKFYEERGSMLDAMPACWMRLSVEQRREVIDIIDRLFAQAKADGTPVIWTKEVIVELMKYVHKDDTLKLRACYLAWKKDDQVVSGEAVVVAVRPAPPKTTIDDHLKVLPESVMAHYKANKENKAVQLATFRRLEQKVHEDNW